MNMLEKYNQALKNPGFVSDHFQLQAVEALDQLAQQIAISSSTREGILVNWFGDKRNHYPSGRYIWGGVGRGKTWLMDMFYRSLPLNQKIRFHFHAFMRFVHAELTKLSGQRDPLKKIAAQISQDCRILCLDEFHVGDITDAMLLAGLLDALFKRGIILIATSNQHPDELYAHGLQRERFLPAIALIKSHTEVINLQGDHDHRTARAIDKNRYYAPVSKLELQQIENIFIKLVNNEYRKGQKIYVNNRAIHTVCDAAKAVWFDFEMICGTARASIDYIEIAQTYNLVVITTVPVLGDGQDDKARRFVNLIDELYDHKTQLIIGADVQPYDLYIGRRLKFEFARAISRLLEMRSNDYAKLIVQ